MQRLFNLRLRPAVIMASGSCGDRLKTLSCRVLKKMTTDYFAVKDTFLLTTSKGCEPAHCLLVEDIREQVWLLWRTYQSSKLRVHHEREAQAKLGLDLVCYVE